VFHAHLQIYAQGYARKEQGARIGNGGGGGDKELVNRTNPQSPLIYLP
jgi:hypothetical protein